MSGSRSKSPSGAQSVKVEDGILDQQLLDFLYNKRNLVQKEQAEANLRLHEANVEFWAMEELIKAMLEKMKCQRAQTAAR